MFAKSFFTFWKDLAQHNERDWFEANKQRYRDEIVAPAMTFITEMAPRLAKISRHFVADPRPNGGSMFRIYRDVRFGKDKRPYKDHAGIQFRHAAGKNVHTPGYYVHLAANEVFFGGGVWMPEPDALGKIRDAIAEDSTGWKRATSGKAFAARFSAVEGEALKRPPKGFDAEHPLIETLKQKSFVVLTKSSPAAAMKRDFLDEVEATFVAAKPLMKFLTTAVGADF